VLIQFTDEHVFREHPYTRAAHPAGKTLRRAAFRQLVAAEFAQLLDWYDSDIVHKSIITNKTFSSALL
jgi:hypothetical protein